MLLVGAGLSAGFASGEPTLLLVDRGLVGEVVGVEFIVSFVGFCGVLTFPRGELLLSKIVFAPLFVAGTCSAPERLFAGALISV